MSTATTPGNTTGHDAAHQCFWMLRIGFTALPILFGADKFANLLVDWPRYLAPWIVDVLPFGAATAMYVVGVVEIVAGLVVAVRPRYGAWLVAGWLAAIIVTLLTHSGGYYDVALRDLGLLLGALTLARLSAGFDTAGWPLHVRAARGQG